MNFARTAFVAMAFTFLSISLSACGFKPMHAPNSFGGTGVSYSDISVRSPNNEKIGFLLKQALRDRIGEHSKTRYILSVNPKISQRGLGRGVDDVASRYDLTMTTKFELIEAGSGKTVHQGSVSAISTYGAPRDAYGEIAAKDNAIEQVTVEASDRILTQLARYTPESKK